jgi:putative GTP pyrophosphokinase
MDFWASLEHKIYYKYNKQVPAHLTRQLKEAADIVAELDRRMERLNEEINILKENDAADNAGDLLLNPRELILQILQGGWMSEGL